MGKRIDFTGSVMSVPRWNQTFILLGSVGSAATILSKSTHLEVKPLHIIPSPPRVTGKIGPAIVFIVRTTSVCHKI